MAEILQKDGTWVFDGDALRLTPGRDKNVGLLRKELGELVVPLGALAGVSFEQGKKTGRLSCGCATAPTRCCTPPAAGSPSRTTRTSWSSSPTATASPSTSWTRSATPCCWTRSRPTRSTGICCRARPCPCPSPPGTAPPSFDGEQIRLEWNWKTEDAKAAAGPRTLAVADISAVEWHPAAGLENGHLRFTVRHAAHQDPAQVRPQRRGAVGLQEGPADGAGRGGGPGQASAPGPGRRHRRTADGDRSSPSPPPVSAEDGHDALLRRLRELGELHRTGVLTDEEFAMAKQAILKRM